MVLYQYNAGITDKLKINSHITVIANLRKQKQPLNFIVEFLNIILYNI